MWISLEEECSPLPLPVPCPQKLYSDSKLVLTQLSGRNRCDRCSAGGVEDYTDLSDKS